MNNRENPVQKNVAISFFFFRINVNPFKMSDFIISSKANNLEVIKYVKLFIIKPFSSLNNRMFYLNEMENSFQIFHSFVAILKLSIYKTGFRI